MKPVPMQVKHNPPHSYGDCFRACLASVLERDDVPHFMEDGGSDDWHADVEAWLNPRGYSFIDIPFAAPEGYKLETLLEVIGHANPGVYYLLGAVSPGGRHCVVCLDKAIVHDPAGRPPGQQIVGPDEGIYWVGFVGAVVGTTRQMLVAP